MPPSNGGTYHDDASPSTLAPTGRVVVCAIDQYGATGEAKTLVAVHRRAAVPISGEGTGGGNAPLSRAAREVAEATETIRVAASQTTRVEEALRNQQGSKSLALINAIVSSINDVVITNEVVTSIETEAGGGATKGVPGTDSGTGKLRSAWAAQTQADAKLREQSLDLIAQSIKIIELSPISLERQTDILQRVTVGHEAELNSDAQSKAVAMAAELIELVSTPAVPGGRTSTWGAAGAGDDTSTAWDAPGAAPRLSVKVATALAKTLSSTVGVSVGSATIMAAQITSSDGSTPTTGASALVNKQKRQQMEMVANSVERLSEIVLQGRVVGEAPIKIESRNIQIESRRTTMKSAATAPSSTQTASIAMTSAGPATFTLSSSASSGDRVIDMVLVHYDVDIHRWSGVHVDSSVTALHLKSPNTRTPLRETMGGNSGDSASTSSSPFRVHIAIPLRVSAGLTIVNGTTRHGRAVGAPPTFCLTNATASSGDADSAGDDGDGGVQYLCPDCRFWNGTSEAWSTQGCRVLGIGEDRSTGHLSVLCECDHLTDFAAKFKFVFARVSRTYKTIFPGSIFTLESFLSKVTPPPPPPPFPNIRTLHL